MYKFFVTEKQIEGDKAKIIGEDVNHIANVLRLKKKDKIILCNKDEGCSYETEIVEVSKESITCNIVSKTLENVESNVNVDIYQGFPKMDKMEYIIQKATELGVKNIYPVTMARSIVKLDDKTALKKVDRWNKIAEVAAKQSKRDFIPNIKNVINIENICQNAEKYDIILIAYENEKINTLKAELNKLNREKELKIAVVIGPEGGIDEKEVKKLVDIGGKCITLGKRILRTETASLVILSNIIYEFEL